MRWRIEGPARPLRGRLRVPGDKSVAHRALVLAALADGESRIEGLPDGLDVRSTAAVLAALGVRVDGPDGVGAARVRGVGFGGLRAPSGSLQCGNSGTTMRLLTGLLAAQPFDCRLDGDASLRRRPMRRIVEPLRERGARVGGRLVGDELYAPLEIEPSGPDRRLGGLQWALPVASAQVKGALLLSGLYATGPTVVREPTRSRDHTERMLRALGVPVFADGSSVRLDPVQGRGGWNGFDWPVPGDVSSAAFLLAAALVVPGSHVVVEGVGVHPTRTGLLDVLREMGAPAAVASKGRTPYEEPIGDIEIRHAALRAGRVDGERLVRMIDEVPAFAVVASFAHGISVVRDAAELRVKESDRIEALCAVLGAFGVRCAAGVDVLHVEGPAALRAARVSSAGDHRIAMAAAVLALAAEGESFVEDVACVRTSWPGFVDALRSLGAAIHEEVQT
ncbi:MAG: 3-phosphoshikimate 1-carboxyvinyltransferase [Myxococcota bacterium]|nr:3-phosphoshikimate 1-carboxyvinyltransferase [Myxococcota bacterium]